MRLIRVGAAALNQTPLDWHGNLRQIRQAIDAAQERRISLLCLPELCVTGYGCEDAFHSPAVARTAEEQLAKILPHTRGLVVSLGLPLLLPGGVYDAACLVVDGQVAGFVCKQHLAGDGIHYEPRWFKPWPSGQRTVHEFQGREVPVGDLVFDVGGVRVGFEICEDAWVADRPGSDLAFRGVDIILNPSASHFAFGKQEIRRRFVLEGSRAFAVSYVYANLLGNEAGRAIYDGSLLVASGGKMLAESRRFAFSDPLVIDAVVDVDATRMQRARAGAARAPQGAAEGLVSAGFPWPETAPASERLAVESWEQGRHVKAEEFARAVALGLFDYLRKSRSRGFVVSLSGGADSAAVASLVALAIHWAWDELGPEALADKLPHLEGVRRMPDAPAFIHELLTCVYQATLQNSPITRGAARSVSHGLGARHHEFEVQALVDQYVALGEAALGRPLTWQTDDLALQNVQARVRSPSVWLLANVLGALLLSTSNRSEAAVGYATMDGDTSGGLAPIAGIDKAYLRHWLVWLETQGPAGLGPVPCLASVNRQSPTAELRPLATGQTDEADLMPYDILDAIERAAIRDKHGPLDVWRVACAGFPMHPPRQVAQWVERFFRLWTRNQWKRERLAPSFHLDDENLDPKTWCRFPILSGGYELELAGLWEAVHAVDKQ